MKWSIKKINQVWFGHLLNFLVVLFSVLLAFWLNKKAVDKSLEEKKNNYIQILKTSLETDKSELLHLIEVNSTKVDSLKSFRDRLTVDQDSPIEKFLDLGSYTFFGVDKSPFELIKNSDILQAVYNEQILFTSSAVYYTYDEDIEAIQEEYVLAFQRVIEPYIIDNVNMINRTINLEGKKKIYVYESHLYFRGYTKIHR